MASNTKTTASKRTDVRSRRKPPARIVQNYFLVWLDGNIDENDDDYRNSITKLREISNTVHTFTDLNECITFVTEIKTTKVFMITSGALGQAAVPMAHELPHIDAIYIFCGDKKKHQQWAQRWPKIKGVFTDMTPICEALRKATQLSDQNTISMSFVPNTDDNMSKDLNELDKSFMYTQILKEILLTIDFKPEHFMEFIEYCREQFKDNPAELQNVHKLEKEYRRSTSIWWYTYQCFLFSMLNCALRTMEVDLIIKLGFLLRDLHENITRLHSEQYPRGEGTKPFIVYRGQGLSHTDFDQLKKTKGGLLSFNNFLSTSMDRRVSLDFARNMLNQYELVGILFVMTIDPSIQSTSFANIADLGCYEAEEEILFSMHSVFRIGQMRKIDENEQLWQVDLTLTGDQDPQLHGLTQHIREETFPEAEGWYRLGGLLEKLGQPAQAQQVYNELLDQATNESEEATIYHAIGGVKNALGDYTEAVGFYEKALAINEKTLPSNHPTSYATSLECMTTWASTRALSFHQKALAIDEKTLPSNHPHLATSYNNIALVYDNMGEYSQALSFHQKALAIREKTLPSNHPSLATSYNNIALVYDHMGEYSQALSFHQKALAIEEKTLPSNHPDLATSYQQV